MHRTGSSTIVSIYTDDRELAFVREQEYHPLPSAVKHLSAHPHLVRRLVAEFENHDNLLDNEGWEFVSAGAGEEETFSEGAEYENSVNLLVTEQEYRSVGAGEEESL